MTTEMAFIVGFSGIAVEHIGVFSSLKLENSRKYALKAIAQAMFWGGVLTAVLSIGCVFANAIQQNF